ncbi:MAG: glycosyltransferase [Bryobacteraceae bacterium]|jgi:glycosyltransferase involved in cell wall biosynthesis
MRIQLISKKYLPAAGGSERSIHALLLHAIARGHEVEAVVCADPKYRGVAAMGSVALRLAATENEIANAISRFAPEVVFTQIDWSETAVECARQAHIPVVYFSRVGDANSGADLLVFNSHSIRDLWVRERPELEYRSLVLYPTILADDLGPAQPAGAAILCINPVRAKGGHLILEIAHRLPEMRFLAVRGWCDPSADGVDFSRTPNVKLVPPRGGIKHFCAESFLLLVPSVWNEPFGRVVVEAMSFGLPVLAYRRGGIPEAMGGAGVLLPEEADATTWVEAIQKLTNSPEAYAAQRDLALRRAARYPAECDPGRFFDRLSALLDAYSGPLPLIGAPGRRVNSEWFSNLEDR